MSKIEKCFRFVWYCWCLACGMTMFRSVINLKVDCLADGMIKNLFVALAIGIVCYYGKSMIDLWLIGVLEKVKVVFFSKKGGSE